MNAIELEAPIIDHRIMVSSERLPAQQNCAKFIVLFESTDPVQPRKGALAALRANPAQPVQDGQPLTREQLYDRTSLR